MAVIDPSVKSAQSSKWADWKYSPIPGFYDEAQLPSGYPRRHWRKIFVAVADIGARQFNHRWQSSKQLIQNNGITYNVYGDPQGKERPWPLDPIPLVIDEAEWASLEKAIAQRATLLNAVLADLYGPQRLVQRRLLPAPLLFANPGFLRACHGLQVANNVYLHGYAADLARSPDGRWWVIADRVQAPSGSGYALENRLVSARTLSSAFAQCQVRTLTRYFQVRRDALLSLAPGNRTSPRAVLLTPGPLNETYFEHAFLAKYWGFQLVEGGDLTVRENRVYLKTLAGLEQVDLILRRQDDSWCDPLELRGDSLLGVPGLVQAVRAGNVTVANALGSGLLETPAHMAFLPGLCRTVLGEEIGLPSVATWWCGQKGPRDYVLANMEKLVIKPAFPRYGLHPVFGEALSANQREELSKRIEADPEQFVAQEQVALSTAPIWTDRGLASRHIVMRVFAAWDGHGYTVMPGGLTRVSTSSSSPVVSMQQGGGSKDTWVLGSSEEHTANPVRAPRPNLQASRAMGDLPSRVADNLFWLGRYTERVEASVRFVRALLPALSGEADFGQAATLETALYLLTAFEYLPKEVRRSSLAEQLRLTESALIGLIHDPTRPGGTNWNLRNVRRVAGQLKERLSGDTWRVLQDLEGEFSRPRPPQGERRFVGEMNLLDRAVTELCAFTGLATENTTRGYGWRFLDIGRRLERGLQTAELLRHTIGSEPDSLEPYLELLLQIGDVSITYRSRYLTTLRADLVLDLLLCDELNPRSIGFQMAKLMEHVENLPQREFIGRVPVEQQLVLKQVTALRLARVDHLAADGARLRAFLDELSADLGELSEALTSKYLSHILPSRLLAAF